MKALFAGGGTGGHLFPAIAIAQALETIDSGCRIEFVGTKYGIEYRMRETLGYPLHLIAIRGLARTFSPSLLLFPLRLAISVAQAYRICGKLEPDVVVGTGGYVAGPVIIAAAIKRIPRVLQEQNSFPGLVTRKLASRVAMIFTAYKKAGEYLPKGVACRLTGNPIRRSITTGSRAEGLRKFGLRDDRKTILVLGGSQGAHRINEAVLRGLEHLDDRVQILWQCGKRDYKEVAARLEKKEFAISLFPFSNDMDLVYAAADLAIARAGALTIAELMACGIPAVLIPYPYAAADHQTFNAAEVARDGGAEIIPDTQLDVTNPVKRAVELVCSDRLSVMQGAAKTLGRPDAAFDIAREIMHLAQQEGKDRGSKRQDDTA